MKLHDVNEGVHKNKKRRRIGRGPGSGWGKDCRTWGIMAKSLGVAGRKRQPSRVA